MLHDHIALDRRHRIVPVAGQHGMVLFVPAPLPRHVEMHDVQGQVERLIFQIGRLWARLQSLPDPMLFHRSIARWDAVVASGSHDRTKDLQSLLSGEHGKGLRPQQILNCAALNDAVVLGTTQQPSPETIEPLLKAMHATLTRSICADGDRGRYRTRISGSAGFLVGDGRIGPPPADHIEACMRNLVEFIVGATHLPSLILLAMVWAQFLAISPFPAGNQLVGPALVTTLLRWQGYPPIFLSEALASCDQTLPQALQSAILRGEWQAWFQAVMNIIENALLTTERAIDRMERLSALWKQRLEGLGLHAHSGAYAVLELIVLTPFFDIGLIKASLGSSFSTASSVSARLVQANIIRPWRDVRRGRFFQAPEALSLFEAEPPAGNETASTGGAAAPSLETELLASFD